MARHADLFSKRRIFISTTHLPRPKYLNQSASDRRDSKTQ
jgi:hypothetical protein